jgi:hypothetical protein
MNTQVIFNIDKRLKDQAMKKAQMQGLPFGVILKLATQAFVDGSLCVGLFSKEEFNTNSRKRIEGAVKDIKEKKNLSPRFSSTKEAVAYLKN